MAVDPQALLAATRCYACLAPGQLQLLKLGLLRQILLEADPAADASVNGLLAAACCDCYSPGELLRIKVGLFQVLAEALDPEGDFSSAAVLEEAKCLNCYDGFYLQLMEVGALLSGTVGDTSRDALLAEGKCFSCLPPGQMQQVEIGLLRRLATLAVPDLPDCPTLLQTVPRQKYPPEPPTLVRIIIVLTPHEPPTPPGPSQMGLKISDADFLLQETADYILLEQGGAVKVGDLPVNAAPALFHDLVLLHDPLGSPVTERSSLAAFFDSAQSLAAAGGPTLGWQMPLVVSPSSTPQLRRATLQAVYDFMEMIGAVLPSGIWCQIMANGRVSSGTGQFRRTFGDWQVDQVALGDFVLPTGISEGYDRFHGNSNPARAQSGQYFLISQNPHMDFYGSFTRGSARLFVGFVSSSAEWTNDTPVGDFMGFVMSGTGGRNDTTVWALCRSRMGETRVNTGLSGTSTVLRRYQVHYFHETGEAVFTVDGVVKATITTNLPNPLVGLKATFGCFGAGTDVMEWSRVTFTCLGRLPSPLILTPSLPQGYQGEAYSKILTSTLWTPGSYTWALIGGALPAGLSLNASTGLVDGTPTNVEVTNPVIQVTDSHGKIGSRTFSFEIVSELHPPSGILLRLESLDFDAAANLDPVTLWEDLRSGSGLKYLPISSSLAPWVSQTVLCNGHATVRFELSTAIRYLVGANGDWVTGSGMCEVFAVVRRDADPPAIGVGFEGAPFQFNNASDNSSHIPAATGDCYECFGNLLRPLNGNPATSFAGGVFHCYQVRNSPGTGQLIIHLDVEKYYDAAAAYFMVGQPNGGYLGVGITGTTLRSFAGNIAALYTFDHILSGAERTAMDAFLFAKWGIHCSLT